MSILGNNLLAQYYAQNQGLPFGYEAVEYLESTGTQWIDTGVKWGTYDWEVEFTCLGCFRFGVDHQNVANGTWNSLASLESSSYFWKNFYSRYNFDAIAHNAKVKISCRDGLYIDNVLENTNIFSEGNDSTTNINMLLFAPYGFYMGGADLSAISEKHNDFIVRRITGEMVRNLIPCVRKSDGKPGMYDLCKSICPLTGTPFYINAGTGEFVTP